MSKTIVVKVGSNVLTKTDGELDTDVMSNLVEQIAILKKEGHTVVLVSSGAVASGKTMYKLKNTEDLTTQRQVYSAIGQVKLMNIYNNLFSKHEIICAQVLATKEDFIGGDQYKNMKNCFKGLLLDSIIPIVNENDVVSLDELMFTDNDELAGLTAFLIGAEHLLILSNIDGMFDGDPKNPNSKLIPIIRLEDNYEDKIQVEKSSAGRGGMVSKYNIGSKMALKGIVTTIANGKKENIILDVVAGKSIGTSFAID
jgi:glutamate 5-kinase